MVADIFEQLREAIITGELHPNERLVEAELVQKYGSSRTAVRTALVRLGQAGLVEHERNRGAKVRLVHVDEAIEIYETRTALEALAAGKAAERATAADHAELRRVLARIDDHLASGDLDSASDDNAALHDAIIRISQHGTIARLVGGLNPHLVRFQYRTLLQPDRPRLSLEEHRAIVEAIIAGDSDAAESAMRSHLAQVTETLHRPLPQRNI
jgi:DNA-binding GntR family transcriptional regulator